MNGWGIAFIGAVSAYAFWLGHEKLGTGRIGSWGAPERLRALLRHGPGPVVVVSALFELWSLSIVAIGLARGFGVIQDAAAVSLLRDALFTAIPIGALWVIFAAAERVRRGSTQ